MAYKSITQIGRSYGRTVAQMRRILEDKGYILVGDRRISPTEKALREGIATMSPLDPYAEYSYGRTEFAKWCDEKVAEVMATFGEKPGERQYVHSVFSALKHIEQAFAIIADLPRADKGYARYIICSMHCGNIGFSIMHPTYDSLRKFREDIAETRAFLAKKRGKWREAAKKADAHFVAVEEFLKRLGCQDVPLQRVG